MNKNLTNRIIEYLQLETNYAIIINGDYGIGKTYYIKNELFPIVSKIKTSNNEKEETFLPILISLFGVKSIEEIQNQIFIELYPILKSKGLKIAAGLTNAILKNFGNDLKDIVKEIGTSSENLTDYSKVLICIDDIDRKSKDLNLKEVFGFVNNLVENYNAKIILIANEDKLRKEMDDVTNGYSLLREKVIGISVTFKSNVSQIFDEIVKSKYETDNKSYYEFLNNHKNSIVNRITQNKDNLRNLLFFLEHFKVIFNKTIKHLKNDNKYKSIIKEITRELLDFSLPISIEYKMGNISPSNYYEIEKIYSGFDISSFLGRKEKVESEKKYIDIYKEKYFEKNRSKRLFFPSIFNYIIGEKSFEIQTLVKEINTIYKFENDLIPERELIISKLNYWKCVDLKYSEYRTLTNSILKFVDKGEYSLEQYPTLFHYATRFNNILNYDIDKLINRFKKGILKGKNFKHRDNLKYKLSVVGSNEFKEEVSKIINFCININNDIKKKNNQKELKELLNLLSTDINKFIEKVAEKEMSLMFRPFFIELDFHKIWKALKNAKNTELIEFAFFLRHRYGESIYKEIYPEKEFLLNLSKKIEDTIKNKSVNKMKIVALNFLNEMIVSKCLINFSE